MSGLYDPTPFTVTDGQRLDACRRLRDVAESRVDAALLALDPDRPSLLRELAELRHKVDVLTNELEARRALAAPTLTGPGANGALVAVAADGRTWEVTR